MEELKSHRLAGFFNSLLGDLRSIEPVSGR
jgi:hypothetical protein